MKSKISIGLLILLLVVVMIMGERKFNQPLSKSTTITTTTHIEEKQEPETFSEKLLNGNPVTVVFLGDSTTEQNETTEGSLNHVGLFNEWFSKTYPGLVKVANAGVSGNTIVQMKDRLNKDVISHNPDLVIVCSGVNDSGGTLKVGVDEFEKNYSLLIKEILDSGAEIILRTPNLTLDPLFNQKMEPYIAVIKKLAVEYKIDLFDFYALEKKGINNKNIVQSKLMYNTIHPNAKGQQYIFDNFKSYLESEIIKAKKK